MAYSDMKVAVSAMKIANCKKCAKQKVCACRVGREGFWKILANLPRNLQRAPNTTEACQGFHICSTVAFPRVHNPVRGCITDIRCVVNR